MAQALHDLSAPPRMSYEEFLRWDGGDQHVEWVDGEVVFMSPVNITHMRIVNFLSTLFLHFAEEHGGEIGVEMFQMKTGPDLPGRAPDILYVAPENLHRLRPTYLDGPADVVVEVVSPDDPKRDRVVKFREYERGGVLEYWLIDPQVKEVIFYRLADGRFEPTPTEDGIFRSTAMEGFWISVDWLFGDSMPPVLSVLKEWKMI
jgi:Uma2 family endonuclease